MVQCIRESRCLPNRWIACRCTPSGAAQPSTLGAIRRSLSRTSTNFCAWPLHNRPSGKACAISRPVCARIPPSSTILAFAAASPRAPWRMPTRTATGAYDSAWASAHSGSESFRASIRLCYARQIQSSIPAGLFASGRQIDWPALRPNHHADRGTIQPGLPQDYPIQLRRVKFYDAKHDKLLVFLTNTTTFLR